MSRLVVMGSGETTPTMVRVHREVFAACPAGPAVMLDTPFAFQMNRAELVTKTRSYFAQSVGREVEVAAWSGREDAAQAGNRIVFFSGGGLHQVILSENGPSQPVRIDDPEKPAASLHPFLHMTGLPYCGSLLCSPRHAGART